MPEKAAEWSLAESDAELLGPQFQMAEFEIRMPKQFRFIEQASGTNKYIWVGPIRSDENYPSFAVVIADLPEKEANSPLESLFKDVIWGIHQRHDRCTTTKVELGMINGLSFVRTSWTGYASSEARESLAGREVHGIAYLTVVGKRAVQFLFQDNAPAHEESLKLGELAAFSFRKVPLKSDSP